ncbi:hypothetical protein ABVK25_011055 [Lepraria finkii]|uniref:Major facilitator superfamily (MFS) profile domain-containing protein n=1 Tax=Lepraria finkii TaxID=1340010 RepID=A0ABR4ARH7_9LECA
MSGFNGGQGSRSPNNDSLASSDTLVGDQGVEEPSAQHEKLDTNINFPHIKSESSESDHKYKDQRLKVEEQDANSRPNELRRTGKKIYILLCGIVAVVNSTLGSSLPSGAINYIGPYFHVTSDQQLVLPISLFLVGYILGPLFFGPLSKTYRRKIIILSSFTVFIIFTIPYALAPDWPTLLIFRLICGINASSAIAVVGGLYADVFRDTVIRGRTIAIFMAATTCGPMLAPIISGFVSVMSWRWTFWVGLIVAGASMVFLIFLPETYGPTILKKRVKRIRKETGNPNVFVRIELEKKGAKQIATVTLMRPLHMIVCEAIVLFTCLYLLIAYAIFYLFFEAYPLIFEGIYHMSPGVAGLAFLPILVGAIFALAIFIYYDSVLQRAKKANAYWASIEEFHRLPLACFGGPLYVISLFWLGWTASPNIY